jgi:hypothetical protein
MGNGVGAWGVVHGAGRLELWDAPDAVAPMIPLFGQYIRDSLPQMSSPTAKHSQMIRITRGFMVSGRCVWMRGIQNHHTKLKRERYGGSGSAYPLGAVIQ